MTSISHLHTIVILTDGLDVDEELGWTDLIVEEGTFKEVEGMEVGRVEGKDIAEVR